MQSRLRVNVAANGAARWRMVPVVVVLLLLTAIAPVAGARLAHAHAGAADNSSACAASPWAVISTPNTGTTGDGLYSVSGVSSGDVWAVGAVLDLTHSTGTPIAEHWNGSAWSLVSTPPVGDSSGVNYLDGVAAIAANDVWAVGGYSTSSLGSVTLIEQWKGSSWSVVNSPNVASADNALDAVTALSAANVWAVGSYTNSAGASYTLIEHWDGAKWTIIPSPNGSTSSTATNVLYDLAGVSANDLWAVGQYETSSAGPYLTLAEHWNGTAWSLVPTANVPSQNSVLSSVAGVSSDDMWTVGDAYASGSSSSTTLIEHWNGTAWSVVSSPNPGTSNSLLWVTAFAPSHVVAVGSTGAHTLVEQWNGTAWQVVPSPDGGTSANTLIALTALSPTELWAVGDSRSGSNPRQTLALHYSTLMEAGPSAAPARTSAPTNGGRILCRLGADSAASSAGAVPRTPGIPTVQNPRWQLVRALGLARTHRNVPALSGRRQ